MTELRKAAEMALDALEGALSDDQPYIEKSKKAAEALSQALAQPEQEFVGACVTCGAPKGEWLVDAVNISTERVDETAKREHEPVCFLRETSWSYEIAPWDDPNGIPVYTAPPISDYHEGWEEGFKAAKREWVGLTDEEFKHFSFHAPWEIVQEIEAKLKEKNSCE